MVSETAILEIGETLAQVIKGEAVKLLAKPGESKTSHVAGFRWCEYGWLRIQREQGPHTAERKAAAKQAILRHEAFEA